MNRPWLTTGLVLVIAILGALGIHHEADAELQRAISRFRAALPPGALLTYSSATPRILHRGAAFRDLRFVQDGRVVTAHLLTINNPSGIFTQKLHIARLHAEGLFVSGSVIFRADDLTITALDLPALAADSDDIGHIPDPSLLRFRRAVAVNASVEESLSHCRGMVGKIQINHYGLGSDSDYALGSAMANCPRSSLNKTAYTSTIPFPASTSVPNEAIALHLNHMEGTGADLATMLASMNAVHTDAPQDSTNSANGHVELSGLSLDLSQITFNIPHLTEDNDRNGVTRQTHTVIDAPTLRLNDKPIIPILAQGPAARITLDATSDTTSGAATLRQVLELPNRATLTLGWRFLGPPREGSQQTMTPTARLGAIKLTNLTVDYHDQSLIGVAFDDTAAKRQMPTDQLRAQVVANLTLATAALPALAPLPGYVNAPSGKSIEINFTPSQPMPILTFASLFKPVTLATHPEFVQPPILTMQIH